MNRTALRTILASEGLVKAGRLKSYTVQLPKGYGPQWPERPPLDQVDTRSRKERAEAVRESDRMIKEYQTGLGFKALSDEDAIIEAKYRVERFHAPSGKLFEIWHGGQRLVSDDLR